MTQLRLFPRPDTERRRVLEAHYGWTARNLLANRPRSQPWPRRSTVSEAPPSAPRPADAALLVLGAVPDSGLDEWCVAFAERLNEQRAAYMDALADSGS